MSELTYKKASASQYIASPAIRKKYDPRMLALHRISSILLSNFEEVDFDAVARSIGSACECDQAGILLMQFDSSSQMSTQSAACWENPRSKKASFISDDLSGLYLSTHFSDWLEILSEGGIISTNTRALDPVQSEIFQSRAIAKILLIPCMVSDKLQACIYICDKIRPIRTRLSKELVAKQRKVFGCYSDETVELLRMCAVSLSQAFSNIAQLKTRKNLEARLHRSERIESLGVLAGGIAHEFNNILAAILGNAQLIENELPAKTPASQFAAEIRKASMRASELTKKMLTYTGASKMSFEIIEVNRLVQQTVQQLREKIPEQISLQYSLGGQTGQVVGNQGQITQLIENLVTNASEAISPKSGKIQISSGKIYIQSSSQVEGLKVGRIQRGNYIYIDVTDNGCGMNEITCENLFDPFFSTKFTGRGLGMPAVYGITKSHLGAIAVLSKPGQGTSVRIFIPRKSSATDSKQSVITKPGKAQPASLKPMQL